MEIKDMTNEELDKVVAVEVMGWQLEYYRQYFEANGKAIKRIDEWSPSTEISDAWMVAEISLFFNISKYTVWACTIQFREGYLTSASAEKPERAICEAALMAVRGE